MQNFPLTQLASGFYGDRELNILYKENWAGSSAERPGAPGRAEGPPALETLAPGATDNRRRQRPGPPPLASHSFPARPPLGSLVCAIHSLSRHSYSDRDPGRTGQETQSPTHKTKRKPVRCDALQAKEERNLRAQEMVTGVAKKNKVEISNVPLQG